MNLVFVSLGITGLLIIYLWATYNRLVILKARIEEALSGIDVQLKRRADLIPNLLETVKGYAKHEKEVFENVTKARSYLLRAKTVEEKALADNQLTYALKTLFAVAENYPQLQASTNFVNLQKQLEDTEDKIAYARQFYNSNVLEYNTKIEIFPNNLIAHFFKFEKIPYFEAEEEERKKITVNF